MKIKSAFAAMLASLLLGLSLGVGLSASPIHHEESAAPAINVDDQFVVPMPAHPTNHQTMLLAIAYQTAKADGLAHPQLLQGIILQESHAGELPAYKVGDVQLPPNRRSYGVSQIKLETARGVLKRYPDMWVQFSFQTHTDEEIIAKLIDNDEFNIAVASKYALILQTMGYKGSGIAVAYNKGPGGAQGVDVHTDAYATGVAHHMSTLPPEPRPAAHHGVMPDVAVYHVEQGDWLSSIAAKVGISQDRIFAANPTAFIGGDPNMLMAGVDLTIPRG